VGYSSPLNSATSLLEIRHLNKHFVDKDLRNHDFSHCELAGAQFVDCQLAGASFRGAELCGACFERSQLFNPEAEQRADFCYADVREARFSNCDLTTVDFSHCRAYGLVVEHCQAQGVDLSNADFALPITRGSASGLAEFTMDHCNFAYGDLSNTFLKACRLTNNRMVEALLHNTVLDQACLCGSDLSNISGKGMSLAGADLRAASFNNLDPRTLDLTGVRITPDQGWMLLATLGLEIGVETGVAIDDAP
jgi:fluoroquinolone resistance protein